MCTTPRPEYEVQRGLMHMFPRHGADASAWGHPVEVYTWVGKGRKLAPFVKEASGKFCADDQAEIWPYWEPWVTLDGVLFRLSCE